MSADRPRPSRIEIDCSCRQATQCWTYQELVKAPFPTRTCCVCGAIWSLDPAALVKAVVVEKPGKFIVSWHLGRQVVSYFALLLALLTAGCSSTPRVEVGDGYSTVVRNEGRPTWARTVDSEKWCEWFYDNKIKGGPWLVVAFDLEDWDAWTARRTIAFEKSVEVNRDAGTAVIDGLEYRLAPEPRAKWARYSLSWGIQAPRD